MANWSLPTLTSTYTNFLTEVTGRDTDVALGLDPANTTVTNPPTNAIRWNSAQNRWEKFNGTTWGTLSATYAFTSITASGTLNVTGATTLAAATATTPAAGATGTEVITAAWINAKAFAQLVSPALTGTPTAPTAAVDTNTTQIATTAYVVGQDYAKLVSPALSGTPTAPTAAANTNTTQIATTAFVLGQGNSTAATIAMNGTQAAGTSTLWARADHVHPRDTSRAPLASPTFTGTPAGPTAAVDTNTTQLATTAYVVGQAGSATPLGDGTATVGTSLRYARQDHIHPTDTSRAPTASPSFTGTATFAGDITITGTGFLDLPVGTTAQRPGSPTAGMMRYNSTTSEFEGYGSSWGPLGSKVPAGVVLQVAMDTAPTGYLKANGAAVSRTVYADLFAAIGTTFGLGDGSTTFNLPDLRGEFIRGWDDARGIDSGRVFGSAQADELKSHTHTINDPGHSHTTGLSQGSGGGARALGNGNNSIQSTTGGSGTGITINSSGGTETRPRNIALLAVIKF